jgi:choice-of-anchor A domain-containing protein
MTLGLLSNQVHASSPGDADYVVNTNAHVGSYNLILSEDLDYQSHIYEKILVGGDIKAGSLVEVGSRINGGGVDAVVVLGDLGGTVKADKGNNIVYGTQSGTTYLLDAGGTSTTITNLTAAQTSFNTIWQQAVNDSAHFKTLSSTGTLNSDNKFENNNSLDLNIFNIDASNMSSANVNLALAITPTTPIVINVAGTGTININAKALINQEVLPLVLWNFYEATEINFSGDGWNGSVLAPFASINLTTGAFDGSLVAKSLTSDKQLHNQLFTYNPPLTPPSDSRPPSEVPAPASLGIITLGLIFIVRRKLTK